MSEEQNINEPQNPAFLQGAVICRCYICNKEITDEKDKLEMHGEIVCSQCWDDNMYMALQDGGGC